mmetsp:Transcript_57682/g.168894  ORF Transcript_57682/g.168894 Transcript_57682/m.168894 type:complete len:275 (+) Transcript_57682:112-936(+)
MSAPGEDASAPPNTGGAGGADSAQAGGAASPAAPAGGTAPAGAESGAAPARKPRLPPEKLLTLQKSRGEAHERLHLESCGRQITSVRRTNPVFTFGSPRQTAGADRSLGRCREITGHPSNLNPAPGYLAPSKDSASTTVLKGWGQDRRFHDDPSVAQTAMPQIRHSTNASPFSQTYPYEEPPKDPKALATAGTEASASAEQSAAKSPIVRNSRRENPQAQPDYNALHCQFSRRPQWSFGSSGIGGRFWTGTEFSRQAQIPVTSRQLTFRELRAT